jgi:hypothetical protein
VQRDYTGDWGWFKVSHTIWLYVKYRL